MSAVKPASKRLDGRCKYGFRYLDVKLGRWMSRDPIGEWGGPNLYALGVNRILTSRDALGLQVQNLFHGHTKEHPLPCSEQETGDPAVKPCCCLRTRVISSYSKAGIFGFGAGYFTRTYAAGDALETGTHDGELLTSSVVAEPTGKCNPMPYVVVEVRVWKAGGETEIFNVALDWRIPRPWMTLNPAIHNPLNIDPGNIADYTVQIAIWADHVLCTCVEFKITPRKHTRGGVRPGFFKT